MKTKHSSTVTHPPRGQNGQRGDALAVQSLAIAIIISILVFGGTACSSTKDLGPRGDARLYQDSGWILSNQRLELNPVPLNTTRTYVLKATDLEAIYWSFDLHVRTKPGRFLKNRLSKSSTRSPIIPDHPIVRVRFLDQNHREFLSKTIGSKEQPWEIIPLKWSTPVLKSQIRDRAAITAQSRPPQTFTVIVEILQPSDIPGRFLHITSSLL